MTEGLRECLPGEGCREDEVEGIRPEGQALGAASAARTGTRVGAPSSCLGVECMLMGERGDIHSKGRLELDGGSFKSVAQTADVQ